MSVHIIATSDLHGHLPDLPQCDIVVIAGDISPEIQQNKWGDEVRPWWADNFSQWVMGLPCRHVVACAGNHDFLCEADPVFAKLLFPVERAPQIKKWHYLQDSGVELMGLRFWGTPWQPPFYDWAFNLPEDRLAEKFAAIPGGLDVLLSHGPPLGIVDKTPKRDNVGSSSLLWAVRRACPRVLVCGHIHHSYGRSTIGETDVYNAAHCSERYKPINEPWHIHMEVKA